MLKTQLEVAANDYNSPFIRNYIWVSGVLKFKKLLGISQSASDPVLGIFSENNQIKYLADMQFWLESHNKLKNKVVKNYHFFENLIDKTIRIGEDLNKWTEKNIFKADLTKLKYQKLLKLLAVFIDKQASLYAYGIALPILDFQDFSFIEGNLSRYLRSKLQENEYAKYYQVFTEPDQKSFAQDQEIALLRLMSEFYGNKRWRKDVLAERLDMIKKAYPAFYSKLSRHADKYGWVYYAYAGPAFDEEKFLEFMKEYLNDGIDPRNKLKEIQRRQKALRLTKRKFINRLKPDAFNAAIIDFAGKLVWAKPRRKDFQSKSYYHLEKLLAEIAKRLFISLDDARSAPIDVLLKGFKNGRVDFKAIKAIGNTHCCLPGRNGNITVIRGSEARKFYLHRVKKESSESHDDKAGSLKGMCACAGTAKGIVKIINKPSDMVKMENGNILVSTATTPSIILAMKKAAAIITDEGGLTCHAAIVSRELEIPCIVGVKVATKILKDGDMITVDASKGMIKILK